jgi:hypothetical protein
VDGEVSVLALEVLERVQVPSGRVPRLGAGDVETDHAVVTVLDDELRDLARVGLVPHRGEQLTDDDRPVGRRLTLVEPALHRRDDVLERQSFLEVLLRGVADLGVHDAVGREVLDTLAGDPGQVVGGLHHRDGVVEGLQVALERS